tara:strand:+ start:2519 stop:2797 length:279 start_codon:yes stop_codon:yes gene_type:complete
MRLSIDNLFLVSSLGSFIYGFILSINLNKEKKDIILTGFCASFTTFSGLTFKFHELIQLGFFVKVIFLINMVILSGVIMMFSGFLLGKKITR